MADTVDAAALATGALIDTEAGWAEEATFVAVAGDELGVGLDSGKHVG